jgi:hypothetical protein
MLDNPSEKNDSHGDTECGEFYACQESMEIEGAALFALAGSWPSWGNGIGGYHPALPSLLVSSEPDWQPFTSMSRWRLIF